MQEITKKYTGEQGEGCNGMDHRLDPRMEAQRRVAPPEEGQLLAQEALQQALSRIEAQALSILKELVLLRRMMGNPFASLSSRQQEDRLEPVLSLAPLAVRLTGQEQRIVALVRTGAHNKAIALALGVTEATIGKHIQNIFRKCQVHTRTEMLYKLSRLEAIRVEQGEEV